MNVSRVLINCLVVLTAGTISQSTFAESSENKPIDDQGNAALDMGGAQFFIGVRPWAAKWDIPLVDTKTVLIDPVGPVIGAQSFPIKVDSETRVIPLTVLGVRYGNYTLSANIAPRTEFSTGGLTTGDVSREEADLSLSYAFTPNIQGSIVYKAAKVSQAATADTTALTGLSAGYKLQALLFGVSASTPLQDKLSLYANFAVGPTREKANVADIEGNSTYNGLYTIVELGLSYRLLDYGPAAALKSLSLQLGYRSQTIEIRDLVFGTFDGSGTLVSSEHRNVSSTTQGPVLGIIGIF